MLRIGLIADTHNLLRPEALAALAGCDHLIHAGDIANSQTLQAVAGIAPLTVVRGNNDAGAWAENLPEVASVTFEAVRVLVIHDLKQLNQDPAALGVQVVVSGHSHRPVIEWRDGVLYINPGSAGRRRFKLPITLAELTVDGAHCSARLIDLERQAV